MRRGCVKGNTNSLPQRGGEQRARAECARHRQRVKVEQARDLVRVQAALLRPNRLQHARAQRAAQARDGSVHELAQPLVFGVRRCAHGAGHARARVDAEQRLEELALGRDRLVHPCEHVADVAQRVVRVQLDRPCACAAAGRAAGC